MLKGIAGIAVLGIVGVLAYATTLPDTFRVERSITIQAYPEQIFPLINNLQRWDAWSPWEKKDPAMARTHSGSSEGKGAIYEWEGNKEVGKGRMEIIESIPPSTIVTKLDFIKPFEAHNTAEFMLESVGVSTNVTWSMRGPNSFVSKVMGIFISMDNMLGPDFETGLGNLKSIAEK